VWAGVACAWLLIIGLDIASFDRTPQVASRSETHYREDAQAFAERRQMLAQLTDWQTEPVIARPSNPPGPRSERMSAIVEA
jgi:hypothetical protein